MNYPETAQLSILPLLIILLPILSAPIAAKLGLNSEGLRNIFAAAVTAAVTVMSAALFLLTYKADVIYPLPGYLDLGLHLYADPMGAFFTLLSALIWFLATVFSITYMDHEHARNRYYFFLLLTQGGCLGVFLTGDLFSLFIFFEIMSVASYLLVIHSETDKAMAAGRNYLYLGIGGGLSLLAGIFLLKSELGTTAIKPLLEMISIMDIPLYLPAAFLIIGFGIKAGMAPLHIWLPQAHPVAPAPASGLLSGIMIKTGAYGIFRVSGMIFTPTGDTPLWDVTANLGYVIIWTGIVTMFMAASIALFQSNTKRILAYSSVSQMGYILMGAGCAAYMGMEGPMGFSGTMMHIYNHAFFKAGMFMMVGAVYARTHRLELDRLGGLFRQFPVTAAAFIVAAGGIAGVPGLNGYASKTLLHHAIEDAYAYGGDPSLLYAENVFVITSAFTVCYMIKLTRGVFFGTRSSDLPDPGKEPLSERIVFGVFALAILFSGLFPNLINNSLILPLSRGFTYDPANLAYLEKLNFWTPYDLQNIALALGTGTALFLFMNKTGFFKTVLPGWLSIESLIYRPLVFNTGKAFTFMGQALELNTNRLYEQSPRPIEQFCRFIGKLEQKSTPLFWRPALENLYLVFTDAGRLADLAVDRLVVKGYRPLLAFARQVGHFDQVTLQNLAQEINAFGNELQDRIFNLGNKVSNLYSGAMRKLYRKAFFAFIKADYDTKGDPFYQMINPMNYNFDLIVVWILLLTILVLGVIII